MLEWTHAHSSKELAAGLHLEEGLVGLWDLFGFASSYAKGRMELECHWPKFGARQKRLDPYKAVSNA